ncbi:MAG: HD domain-containing protein [Desulfovibrio sp.]|nr:HD domain-containing protein [Desulfovibrio sp.]
MSMDKKKGIRITLQGKLLYPVVIALVLFMGGSALVLSHILTDTTEETYVSMLSAGNEILVKNIRNATSSYKNVLKTISIIPQLQLLSDVTGRSQPSFIAPVPDIYREGVWSKAEALLLTLSDIFPDISQFNFAVPNGDVIASSRKQTIGKVNVVDRKWFARTLESETVISSPLMSKSIGEKAVVVAAPVYASSGDIGGVVYAVIPCLRVVSDTIRDVKMSETGYAYIVDGDSGLMIAHNVWSKIQTMNMFEWQPWMRELRPGDHGIKKDYVDSAGNRRLAVYRREPTSGWIAVSCVSTEEIEAQKTFVRNLIFALTIGGALITGFFIFRFIRPATNDLHRVRDFAKEVAGGKLDGGISVNRNDEIGDLGDAINAMVRSLRCYVAKEIHDTEERRKEFAALRDALMLTLAGLVESRDANTGHHIRKTAAYVKIITYKLKENEAFKDALTDTFVDNIIRSAPLHDIGKINVPDAILNKPGRLTPEEFETMKTHTTVGGQIIHNIISVTPHAEYLREAENLATYHHERWDGKGYPKGLKGREIPLSARIMAVADVFDALVSKRAYKDGFPIDKAFAIIREESGTHFDPSVVDAFFAAKNEVVNIERQLEREISFAA